MADELAGYQRAVVYDDDTVVRVSIHSTASPAYPSGWRYTLHYGALVPGDGTLEDGTVLRYDNAHEDTKGHERHAAPDPEPTHVDFPGMVALYERFWDEIPKRRFGPSEERDAR
jgi:hypothetical protein